MKNNYIQKLQDENKFRLEQIITVQAEINDFIKFLHSPKFFGLENGERKDWISTGDVLNFLIDLRSKALVN